MRVAATLGVLFLVSACQGTPGSNGSSWSTRLTEGFYPDPRARNFDIVPTSGQQAIACSGFFPDQPTLTLQYRAGERFNLFFFARGYADDNLVLGAITPEGETRCDNDGWYARNPRIEIAQPASGPYRVWVGTNDGQPATARLFISEVDQPSTIRTLR